MEQNTTPATHGTTKGMWVGFAVVAVVAIILLFNNGLSKAPLVSRDTTSPTPQPPVNGVVLSLEEQNESGVAGTVSLLTIDNGVKVTIDLLRSIPGSIYPAHIHEGTCAGLGPVLYPLIPITDGSSETTIDTSLTELSKQFPLAVNVHKSSGELDTYVSCALFSDLQ